MIHTSGEQIQANETRNFRNRGARIGEKKGGGVGKLDSTRSLRLDKDPRWAQEVMDVRLYSCWSSARWRVTRTLRTCAVLDCWRQGIAARCLLPCIHALREKENFQLFHFVKPLKMVHSFTMVIKRSPGGDSAGGGRSTSKSTCVVLAWTLTAFGDRPAFQLVRGTGSVRTPPPPQKKKIVTVVLKSGHNACALPTSNYRLVAFTTCAIHQEVESWQATVF